MAKLIPAAKRVEQALDLIREARELPVPVDGGKYNFSYVVSVKAKLRKARELVKLIPKTVGISEDIKAQARQINVEADLADQEIFHGD